MVARLQIKLRVNAKIDLANDDVSDIVEISNSGLFEDNYGRDHESSHLVSKVSHDLKNYFLQREDDEV